MLCCAPRAQHPRILPCAVVYVFKIGQGAIDERKAQRFSKIMTDQSSTGTQKSQSNISFRKFLERVHPSVSKRVDGLCHAFRFPSGSTVQRLSCPPLRLHCNECDGERWFRGHEVQLSGEAPHLEYLKYTCSDCKKETKLYSLLVIPEEASNAGQAYKFGEHPQFGVPVPNRVLKLFSGEDAENFKKGRRCESQALGIAAFAYYRRVVEKHKNEIFDEIIKVCNTLGGSADLINELELAKKEQRFTTSVEMIKAALPQGLLINGHNPLLALHGALSVGLHNETDEACLQAAADVRLILADLVEKISMLKQDNVELNSAIKRLIDKRSKAIES